MLKTLTVSSMLLVSGAALAQSIDSRWNPAGVNTADPNNTPRAGMTITSPTVGQSVADPRRLDAAGRANTEDPLSTNSGATGASGDPVNPMANPRMR